MLHTIEDEYGKDFRAQGNAKGSTAEQVHEESMLTGYSRNHPFKH